MGDNKLIAGCLIGIVLFLVIGTLIIVPAIVGTDDNSATNSSESSVFDNSTPESMAISIARLNEGSCFDSVKVVNAFLTSDGKYWIVNMNDGMDYSWIVKVDAKTGMSKKK